jgi:predicted HD superfamily hydrolase involved in NAD metabolism
MKDYDRIVEKLQAEIDKRFSGKSLARHIRSVAELAVEIAAAHGKEEVLLPRRVHVAALAHDLYKKFPQDELRELILRKSVPIDEFSWNVGGSLLHASLATHYLRTHCGVRDEDLLCAVYYHTTGRAGASMAEKILFCADYLDPSRELRGNEPDVIALIEKAKTDLNAVFREVLGRKLAFTLGKGKPLHPNGIAAWNEVTGNNGASPGKGNL